MDEPLIVPIPDLDPVAVLRAHQRRRMRRRIVRWTLAAVNFALGIFGLFVPIVQGVLHLIVAIALVAPDIPAARRLTLRLYRRFPRVRRVLPRGIRRLTKKDRA